MKRGKFFKIKKPTIADFYQSFTSRSANYWLGVLALFVVISRWIGRLPYLYGEDSIHFGLALEDDYDITKHQPHPPGYALYVLLAKLIYLVVRDANTALIVVSIIFSVGLVYAVFYLAKTIYNQRIAWIATFLLMSSPMVWFHGQIAFNYLSDALFATLFALFVWRSLKATGAASARELWWGSLIFAIGGGFRPTIMLLLAPFWLWAVLRQRSWRVLVAQGAAILGITLAWLIPAAVLSGGWQNLWRSTYSLIFARESLYAFTVFSAGWLAIKTYFVAILANLVTALGWGGVVTITLFSIYMASPRVDGWTVNNQRALFWSLWLVPPLLFHLLIVFTIPGYLLLILPAIIILTAVAADGVLTALVLSLNKASKLKSDRLLAATVAFVMLAVGANIGRYYYPDKILAVQRTTYSSISGTKLIWDALISTIRREFNPQNTVIGIERPFIVRGIPHFQYYLPEYETYQPIGWGQYNPDKLPWNVSWGGKRKLVKELTLGPTVSRLVLIRADLTDPSIELGMGSLVRLTKLNYQGKALGQLIYYDLTDVGVKEELAKLPNIKVYGVETQIESAENQ